MNTKRNTYRSTRHVQMGVANEHAYNMFLSFMEQCNRLGLWARPHSLDWWKIQTAFHRLTNGMRRR